MEPVAPGTTVTLRDVAAASGVSLSTASRALDERGTASRSAAAEHVRKVAEELGYRRNSFASSLRRGETRTLGVLVPRLSDTVMALMFEELERAASDRGYFAMVATSGDDPDDERRAAETLLDRNVDGLILATARLDELPKLLRQRKVAHALVLRTDGVSPSALGDDEVGGYLATRHLIDLGHREIAVVTGPSFTSTGTARLAGARRAMEEAGITPRNEWLMAAGYGIENGFVAGETLLGGSPRPTAVFAANDNLAMGIMAAAHRCQAIMGRDLALVGYNDIPLSSRLPTPLSSVRVPLDQIAGNAIDLIVNPGKEPSIRKSMPTLIPRESSGPPQRRPE
jgi:LacI family transcriptional regulator